MQFIEIKDMEKFPLSYRGMELFHSEYRYLKLNEVIKKSNVSVEYVPYGYNLFILVRSTGIIHAFNNL
jgi:hypothetical protein